jgi:hypothetical protein
MRHPVAPYSFSALLEREADIRELSTVFHLHIPKAGGGTVHTLLRQNNFTALDFDMSDQSFFGTVMEEVWANIQLTPAPRRRFALTGHFRLDAPFLRVVWVPHVVIATLRDPIKRLLSHYNFTQLVPGNPHHEALRTGKMSLVEYAEWLIARNSIGPQYSFFDDTGAGTFAYSGHGSPERCLNNLLNKVSLFGFTDRFEEFCILFGYLLRKQHIAVAPGNDTAGLDVDAQGLKSSLTPIEQAQIEKLYADDIWFFAEARKVYDQRIADPRIQAVLRQTAPRVREVIKMLKEIREIPDPVDATVRAFSHGVGKG